MKIQDKVIIVTGASQGIGEATAKLLAGKGARVVLAARSKNKLEALEKQLKNSVAIITDMRKPDDVRRLVEETMAKYGRIDILVNNAGQGMYGPIENIKIEDFKEIMELNVYAVLEAMQLVIPIMRQQKEGMIVNVSSGVSKRYIPFIGAYSGTKYTLNAISSIARQELAKDNVIVSSIYPKMTSTNFAKNAIGARPESAYRPDLKIDTAEYVAEKILELINTEAEEIVL